jgi:ankyrin repeat protein
MMCVSSAPAVVAAINNKLQTEFVEAICCGKLDTMKKCVRQGVDVNHPDARTEGQTPLFITASLEMLPQLKLLAKFVADFNKPATNGCTPMSVAAEGGHVDVIKTLAGVGANLDTGP